MNIKVNEYAELMSVVAYLSGVFSYKAADKSSYIQEIDEYFAPYKKHKIISKIKRLKMSAEDLISLALLKEKFGNKRSFAAVLKLADDFCEVSGFHHFFEQHEGFYGKICADFNDICSSLNGEWFGNFYGFSKNDFSIVLLPVLQSFYDGQHLVCSNEVDKKQLIQRLIYNQNYAFINLSLGDTLHKTSELQVAAEELFELCAWTMKQQGYDDWQKMFREYLVRAATNVYMQENGFTKKEIRQDIITNFGCGFYIMPELVGYFNKYRYCRDRFKTFGDFYSEIVNFFARHTQREIKRIDEIANTILEV